MKETNLNNNYYLCNLSIAVNDLLIFKVTLDISKGLNFNIYSLGTYQFPKICNENHNDLDLEGLDKIVDVIFSKIEQLGFELDISKLAFKNDLMLSYKRPYLSQNIYVTVNKFPKTQIEIDEDNCLLISKLIPDDEKYLKSLITPRPKSLIEKLMAWRLK